MFTKHHLRRTTADGFSNLEGILETYRGGTRSTGGSFRDTHSFVVPFECIDIQ